MTTDVILLYCTFSSKEEGKRIVRALLDRRLIACANLYDGVESLYVWEGAVQQGKETVGVLKTLKNKYKEAEKMILEMHGYDCPCIVQLPAEAGNPAFLEWIGECVE